MVTHGNVASERLLADAGFVPVTPPVDDRTGVAYYRAATALDRLDVDTSVPVGVTVAPDGAALWLLGRATDTPSMVDVRGKRIDVRWRDVDDPGAHDIVAEMMPVRHIARLLASRDHRIVRGDGVELGASNSVPGEPKARRASQS